MKSIFHSSAAILTGVLVLSDGRTAFGADTLGNSGGAPDQHVGEIQYQSNLAATCSDVSRFAKEMVALGVTIEAFQLGSTAFGREEFGRDFAKRCDVQSGVLRPVTTKGRSPN